MGSIEVGPHISLFQVIILIKKKFTLLVRVHCPLQLGIDYFSRLGSSC